MSESQTTGYEPPAPTMEQRKTVELLQRASIFLDWFHTHPGECLADHQGIRARLGNLLTELKEHVVHVG